MFLILDVAIGFLLQQHRERLLVIRVHRRADKTPNTWRAWWAHTRQYTALRARSGGKLARTVVERLPWQNLLSFPAGNGRSSGAGRWAVPGSARWWPSARGVGANLDDWLDFSHDGVAQACFPLAPEPLAPLSALGSACDRRAQKRAEPADFGVLGVRGGGGSAPRGTVGGAAGDALMSINRRL